MHNRKHSFINSGIVGSIGLYFIFLYSIASFIFFFIFPDLSLARVYNSTGIAVLCTSTLLLFTVFYLYVRLNIKKNIELFINHRNQPLQFLFFSSLYSLLLFLLAILIKYRPLAPYQNYHLGFLAMLLISLPIIKLLHIFVNVFLIKLFYQTLDIASLLDEHGSIIVDLENFLHVNAPLINQCVRMKMDLGIIAIHLANPDEIRATQGKKTLKELSDQISFILQEESRTYERWGLLKSCHIYFCFSMIQDRKEFKTVMDRFKSTFQNQISIGPVSPQFNYYSSLEPFNMLPKASQSAHEKEFLHQQIYMLEKAFCKNGTW
ncbi:MAG: hypothetical protein PF637_00945 [Spirochaetes bacterium]|jgi:hypothetical protein|nr:hypothetical protein [Spirochaetota bacterium]